MNCTKDNKNVKTLYDDLIGKSSSPLTLPAILQSKQKARETYHYQILSNIEKIFAENLDQSVSILCHVSSLKDHINVVHEFE